MLVVSREIMKMTHFENCERLAIIARRNYYDGPPQHVCIYTPQGFRTYMYATVFFSM